MKAKIDKYLGYILVALMMMMTLDVLWGVITRYAMGSQADWSEELARFLLIWIGLLGAAFASGKGMHLAIDLLQPTLSVLNQRRLTILISLLIIVFVTAVLIVGGLRLMFLTSKLGQLSAALRIPMYIVYMILPISGVLIVYYKLHELKLRLSQP